MNQRITRKKSNVFNRIAPTIQTILKNLGYKSIQLYHNQENTNTLLISISDLLRLLKKYIYHDKKNWILNRNFEYFENQF